MTQFQWTDETVKEFILKESNKYNTWDEAGLDKGLNKFKSSKQAKDWEVVLRRRKIYDDPDDDGVHKPDKWCESTNCSIYEVRRLSDKATFQVGEVTQEGKIEKFEIEASTIMWVKLAGRNTHYEFSLLHKLPERKPLFITEDNVDVYAECQIYWVNKQNFKIGDHSLSESSRYYPLGPYFYFSTRAAAEEYVFWNKPGISRKQIKDATTAWELILKHIDKQLNP